MNYFQSNRQFKILRRYFLLISPLFIFFIYFYLIGRNRFSVESDIVIRRASEKVESDISLSSLLGSGNKASKEDSKYMKTYLKSPQVLEVAKKELDFLENYKKVLPDLISGIDVKSTQVEIYNFFRRQITVSFNESNGIISLQTLAFDPYSSYKLNKLLINQAEIFANQLNQNIFERQLDFVNRQVEVQARKVEIASRDLIEFQRVNSILNPETEGQVSSKFISALEMELVKLKVELANLRRKFVSDQEPEILEITNEILELSEQINLERNLLVSPNGKNLNFKIMNASDLENKLKFALDLYKAAITTAETTRIDSLQQQRFISIIAVPQIPDQQNNNWRHKGFFSFSFLYLLLLGLINFFKILIYAKKK